MLDNLFIQWNNSQPTDSCKLPVLFDDEHLVRFLVPAVSVGTQVIDIIRPRGTVLTNQGAVISASESDEYLQAFLDEAAFETGECCVLRARKATIGSSSLPAISKSVTGQASNIIVLAPITSIAFNALPYYSLTMTINSLTISYDSNPEAQEYRCKLQLIDEDDRVVAEK